MKIQDDINRSKSLLVISVLWYLFLTWPFSLCYQTKLLVRKIQSKPNNVTHALGIFTEMDAKKHDNDTDLKNVAVAAIRVCGNVNKHDIALELYNKHQSEATRAVTISVLGSCNQVWTAVKLLEDNFCPPTAASFNAAIAACGRNGNWQIALDIYDNKMPKEMISTLSTNALLTVLAKCRQGAHSKKILDGLGPQTNPKAGSESVTYTLIISALVRSNMLVEASEILQDLKNRQHYCSQKSIEAMSDLVISAYSQRSDWKGVERIERIKNQNIYSAGQNNDLMNAINKTITVQNIRNDYRFHNWKGLEKAGKGKESYWVIGTYQNNEEVNITIGCRPHRNPSKNGIQILFFENMCDNETSSWSQRKIGFLLMKNNWKEQSSSMIGMFLNPNQRGHGISKVCLSIWIWLCLKGSIVPITGIIRKPLLVLVLQHTFGFVCSTKIDAKNSGNLVEIYQDPDDPKRTILYSISGKSLEGALSFSDMKHQNIKIVSQHSLIRGRVIRIGSKLYPPHDETHLQVTCDKFLCKDFWRCDLSREDIQQIFFGKLMK